MNNNFIIELDQRDIDNRNKLEKLHDLIDKKDFILAEKLVKKLEEEWGNDPALIRAQTFMNFYEDEDDDYYSFDSEVLPGHPFYQILFKKDK